MKPSITSLLALLFVIAGLHAAVADEGFLPGRIESRTAARTILAKCAAREAANPENCIGFQFYYSASGNEADAKPLSDRIFTEATLKELKSKPVVFNFFDAVFPDRDYRLFTVGVVTYLNDYEDSWGESTGAKVAYATGRGLLYGTMVPVAAGMDIGGTVVAAPVTFVQVLVKSAQNTKIRKLIRAIQTGKKIPMDINRVYRLRDIL